MQTASVASARSSSLVGSGLPIRLGRRTCQTSKIMKGLDASSLGAELGEASEVERISLADLEQVQRWAQKLGVSADRLRELVAQVGPRIVDVAERLKKAENAD